MTPQGQQEHSEHGLFDAVLADDADWASVCYSIQEHGLLADVWRVRSVLEASENIGAGKARALSTCSHLRHPPAN